MPYGAVPEPSPHKEWDKKMPLKRLKSIKSGVDIFNPEGFIYPVLRGLKTYHSKGFATYGRRMKLREFLNITSSSSSLAAVAFFDTSGLLELVSDWRITNASG